MECSRKELTKEIQLFIKVLKKYDKLHFLKLKIILDEHLIKNNKNNKKIYIKNLSKKNYIFFIDRLANYIQIQNLNHFLLKKIQSYLFKNGMLQF
jgi:hypothetical protein